MPTLEIRRLRTMNQNHVDTTLFDSYGDALALVMDCVSSDDLLALPRPRFVAEFQIIDSSTDTVLVSRTLTHDLEWGSSFWISMGNNWGPNSSDYTTPEKWGLLWLGLPVYGVLGFRGIIRAYSWQGPRGYADVDAFDVSEIRWFRLGL